ncbi:hypothetical protein Dimus_002541 [Dionaea muscipula]
MGEAKMDECLRDCMKKLSLWYTRTFKPMMNHDELEPIMVTLGFVGQPSRPIDNGTIWREYAYSSGLRKSLAGTGMSTSVAEAVEEEKRRRDETPRPRLPYPRIDGLHLCTYRAFIDAVNFYLEIDDISTIFHVRGMPIHRMLDRKQKFHRMGQEESFLVYREGTLDRRTYELYHIHETKNDDDDGGDNDGSSMSNIGHKNSGEIGIKGRDTTSIGNLVPLSDIILWPPSMSGLSLDSP